MASKGKTEDRHPVKRQRAGEDWLCRSLAALAHPDPPSLAACLRKGKAGDGALEKMAIWLEDRVIRQWGASDRENLRQKFWVAIQRYLADLECPPLYYARDGTTSDSFHWRDDATKRSRVVYWLVSCAISESYSDQKSAIDESMTRTNGMVGTGASPSSRKDSFPLGFSTNDKEVDSVVTALRMKYLLELRGVQDMINQSIAEMQQLTVKQEARIR